MAVTLAPDELRDAEVTDGIGLGDVGCAARLWVRYWPTALGAARQYVDPEEVPGLAAEALVGTITAIAIGRGPREDVAGFVAEAVRELGEDDEPATPSDTAYPDLFVSTMMTDAFAALDEETRGTIRRATYEQVFDYESDAALTVLQHYYLAEHADRAETSACRRTHIALMATADGSVTDGLSGENWLHLSTCAWCTEAFHEVAFSSVALDALVAPSIWEQAAPVAAPTVVAAEPDPYEDLFAEPVEEPVEQPVEEPVEEPYDELPAPPEDDEDVAVVATGARPRRRRRVVAGAILTAAAVAIVAVLVSGLGGGDGTSPTAANANPTESSAADLPTESSTPDVPTTSPTPSETATVSGPSETPTTADVETPAAEEPTPTPTSTSTPTTSSPKPSPTPTPTANPTPTTSPTTATPTPTPTAKPTKRCNSLQHLLGIC